MALEVHIYQRPYGTIGCPFAFRKIPEAGPRRPKVHLAAVEKVDISGVTQEYDLTS